MAGRRLSAEEQALWARVIASVRPIGGTVPVAPAPLAGETAKPLQAVRPDREAGHPRADAVLAPDRRGAAANTLDGGWDRRLSRGAVAPDVTIDLHGHTLDSAWMALDQGLSRAIGRDARLLLLVTGRPPAAAAAGFGKPKRGAIRAAVGDWIASSRHSGDIAAVRNAHPRHGGAGALYLVLRRRKNSSAGNDR